METGNQHRTQSTVGSEQGKRETGVWQATKDVVRLNSFSKTHKDWVFFLVFLPSLRTHQDSITHRPCVQSWLSANLKDLWFWTSLSVSVDLTFLLAALLTSYDSIFYKAAVCVQGFLSCLDTPRIRNTKEKMMTLVSVHDLWPEKYLSPTGLQISVMGVHHLVRHASVRGFGGDEHLSCWTEQSRSPSLVWTSFI